MALALSCVTDRPLSADQLSETGDALKIALASSVAPTTVIFFIVSLLQLPLHFSMQEFSRPGLDRDQNDQPRFCDKQRLRDKPTNIAAVVKRTSRLMQARHIAPRF
jgi:hypothetical protein